jgi:diaminopimelate decarboxylase
MHSFAYRGPDLHCEQVTLHELARRFGTPLYVYSEATLTQHYRRLHQAMASVHPQVCFAVKSNSNLAVLRVLARLGSAFDIVSGGELLRVITAGGDPTRCVFAGVGKTEDEIRLALRHGVHSFNVESEAELERINRIAGRLRRRAPVAVRVNPDVDAKTHAKITTGTYENKFGIAFERVPALYARAAKLPHLWLRGVQMHIGSQLTSTRPFASAVRKMVPLVRHLKAQHGIEFFSIGGGLGIVYDPALASGTAAWWKRREARAILTPEAYARALVPLLQPLGLRTLMEPGRFISGNAGALITRVEHVKRTGDKNFVIVDAAMNDLIRPAFYEAFHEIVPVRKHAGRRIPSDVVGPICETGDTFCKDRPLPRLQEGELLAILSAGAYGSVMASTYNSRPLVAEVLVRGRQMALVRQRQKVTDLWRDERPAPWQR